MVTHVAGYLRESLPSLSYLTDTMTDQEYMDLIIKQWNAIDDDPDFMDELSSFEEMEENE